MRPLLLAMMAHEGLDLASHLNQVEKQIYCMKQQAAQSSGSYHRQTRKMRPMSDLERLFQAII